MFLLNLSPCENLGTGGLYLPLHGAVHYLPLHPMVQVNEHKTTEKMQTHCLHWLTGFHPATIWESTHLFTVCFRTFSCKCYHPLQQPNNSLLACNWMLSQLPVLIAKFWLLQLPTHSQNTVTKTPESTKSSFINWCHSVSTCKIVVGVNGKSPPQSACKIQRTSFSSTRYFVHFAVVSICTRCFGCEYIVLCTSWHQSHIGLL
jgi:hypothetical protein